MPLRPESVGARVVGDDLIAVQVPTPLEAQSLAAQLRDTGSWLEAVAGMDSVVVQFDNTAFDTADALAKLNEDLAATPASFALPYALVEIPVCYGGEFGPDLADVCASLGLSKEDFIHRHTASEYRVDMLGFTPGFAYVGGLDDGLAVPRRETPRSYVADGSVGIADRRTGLYALPGPGGWSIVGRTPLRLFDAGQTPPFRLAAGMRVRFRAIDAAEFRATSET